jgi:hypothetical protein
MHNSNSQTYSINQLNNSLTQILSDKNIFDNIYKSMYNISAIIDAIIYHADNDGNNNWAKYITNENDNSILSKDEQIKLENALKPHILSIKTYFNKNLQTGGDLSELSKISKMSPDFIKSKINSASSAIPDISIDDVFNKLIDKVKYTDTLVNNYASKYGILRLEKEHDYKPDVQVIPELVIDTISEALFVASEGLILPPISQEFLRKVKIPFRTIITTCYLMLDIVRLSVGTLGLDSSRKMLSIVVSLIDLLRGDWKKAAFSFIGYYGRSPMLFGEFGKVFISLFGTLSPEIKESIIYGTLDTTKSLIVGILLSIFQVAAPEQIRLPIIGALEQIAKLKAKIDGTLIEQNMSARPDYFAPTFEDLTNIQAVISDQTIVCSKEFQNSMKTLTSNSIIKLILEILRIPISDEMIIRKCGKDTDLTYTQKIAEEAIKREEKQEEKQEKQEEKQGEKEENIMSGGSYIAFSPYKKRKLRTR